MFYNGVSVVWNETLVNKLTTAKTARIKSFGS